MVCHEVFPNAVCLHYCKFASVGHRLQDTGTLAMNRHNTWRGPSVCTPTYDEDVLHFSRTTRPQTPVRLLMNFLLIFVWCGTFCTICISILSIGRRCRLLAPVIRFVEISLCVGLCGNVQRSPNFLQFFFRMRPASPGKRFATPTNHDWTETNPPAAFVHCHYQ